jgi:hypothetical protein
VDPGENIDPGKNVDTDESLRLDLGLWKGSHWLPLQGPGPPPILVHPMIDNTAPSGNSGTSVIPDSSDYPVASVLFGQRYHLASNRHYLCSNGVRGSGALLSEAVLEGSPLQHGRRLP